jgi:nicotinamidase-related amidase
VSLTTLDPKTALIVVDLQKGVVSRPATAAMQAVLNQAAVLTEAFREHGLPVVLVNVDGVAPGRTEEPRVQRDLPPGWTEFVPELNRQPQDHVVTKRTPGAFTNTGLEAHLKGESVTQVVITGVATSNGVEVTARQAYELGFNVALATDAMADVRPEAHAYSLTRVFPRIGETGTTQEIIDLLKASARS